MALELTRKSSKGKKSKDGKKTDPFLKFFEFFEKNPIMKIVIPVLLFVILAAIFIFVIFGDKILTKDNDTANATVNVSASNEVAALPGNNSISDEDLLSLIEKDPLSPDILASAKYKGCVFGSSGLQTGLIEIGTDKDQLVLSMGDTVGDSSWKVTEITDDYILFEAGKLTKRLTVSSVSTGSTTTAKK